MLWLIRSVCKSVLGNIGINLPLECGKRIIISGLESIQFVGSTICHGGSGKGLVKRIMA
jgi:hypothetical protein